MTGEHAPRRHPRFDIKLSAEVHVDGQSFTASTRDVSEGGVGLAVDRPVSENAEVTLGLFLVIDGVEDERFPPLWVKGRVAWSGEGDDGTRTVGVRFEVITDAQKAWLRRLIDHAGKIS